MSWIRNMALAGGLALGVAGCYDTLFEGPIDDAIIKLEKTEFTWKKYRLEITTCACKYNLKADNHGKVQEWHRSCTTLPESCQNDIKTPQEAWDHYIKLIKEPIGVDRK